MQFTSRPEPAPLIKSEVTQINVKITATAACSFIISTEPVKSSPQSFNLCTGDILSFSIGIPGGT